MSNLKRNETQEKMQVLWIYKIAPLEINCRFQRNLNRITKHDRTVAGGAMNGLHYIA